MNNDDEWKISGTWYINVPYNSDWDKLYSKSSMVFFTEEYIDTVQKELAKKECEEVDALFDACESKTEIGKNLLKSIGVKVK